ncbi:MAG TPA: hypothetical protein VFD43_10000, partial [Planctomycetota bacterium]|nr:hypothetical protein [Planctomycetota bacterium]
RAADQAVADFRGGGGDLAAARAAVERAQREQPREEFAARLACELEETQAVRLLEQPASEAAVTEAAGRARLAFQRARFLHPADPSLPRRAAALGNRVYYRTGWPADWLQRAIEDLQAVLALDPLDVESRWELVSVAQRARLHELRDEQLARLFELEPDYAIAWHGLGRLLEADGDLEGALHAYVRAEEALLNCAIKVRFPEPDSSAFYLRNLQAVKLGSLRDRIEDLRQRLYF